MIGVRCMAGGLSVGFGVCGIENIQYIFVLSICCFFFEGFEVGEFMRRVYACLFYVCVWLCFAVLSVLICGVLLGVGIVSLLKCFVFLHIEINQYYFAVLWEIKKGLICAFVAI